MSFLIEQTSIEAKNAFAFSRHAEMANIRLSSGSFENRLRLEDQQKNLEVTFRLTPGSRTILEAAFHASTEFQCAIGEPGEEGTEPVIKMECVLLATYNLHPGYAPTEAEMDAFHKANVTFNTWPFFREFVQSSASKMSLPAPPVPFVRVQVIATVEEDRSLETPKE